MVGVYRFSNRDAPSGLSPMRTVLLRSQRSIKILAKRTGLALTAPAGAIGIRVTIGSLRNCARFAGTRVVRADVPGFFRARGGNVGTLADCEDLSLAGGVTTTSTSTTVPTTTTLLGTCGDGMVNQPSEGCDGADTSRCAGPLPGIDFSCRPPGTTSECTCCKDGGIGTGAVGCCNPSAVLVGIGLFENADCIARRCDPPFPCSAGDTCQADGTCCTSFGATCETALIPNYPFNACCPGLECRRPGSFGLECCIADGGPCTTGAGCCSGVCDATSLTCTP
jgi:hypothetical protein